MRVRIGSRIGFCRIDGLDTFLGFTGLFVPCAFLVPVAWPVGVAISIPAPIRVAVAVSFTWLVCISSVAAVTGLRSGCFRAVPDHVVRTPAPEAGSGSISSSVTARALLHVVFKLPWFHFSLASLAGCVQA